MQHGNMRETVAKFPLVENSAAINDFYPLQSQGSYKTLPLHCKGKWMDAKLEFLRGTLDVLILKALIWGPVHGCRSR